MKKKGIVIIVIWAMICVMAGLIYCRFDQPKTEIEVLSCNEVTPAINAGASVEPDTSKMEELMILVHVCGEVKSPGVYQLDQDARVIDAVTAAGGFLDTADQAYLNQAMKLSDGQRIYIPSFEQTASLALSGELEQLNNSVESDNNLDTEGKIDINSATLGELMSLPGIGQAKADNIIRYRQEHGRFESINDIQKIAGIKEAVYNKIKDLIVAR